MSKLTKVNMVPKTMLGFIVLTIIWFVSGETTLNHDVVSYVTISKHLIKVMHKINIFNHGHEIVNSYIYIEEPKNSLHAVYDQFENGLSYVELADETNANESHVKYSITLNRPVKPRESFMMICHVLLVDKMKAVQKAITIDDDPMVSVTMNIYFYSYYSTLLYRLYVGFEAMADEVFTEYDEVQRKENVIQYNFTNLEPFSMKMNRLVFVHRKPIYVVKELERKIHVSMYGKIHVEDKVLIENRASKLLGDYLTILHSVKQPPDFYTFLPASAEDIQYFDTLGNNSFSSVIYSKNDVTFKHKARYPLYGGWKYTYMVQYHVPIYEYVYTDYKGTFHLQMRAIDHVLGNTFIEKATTQIILPEFAQIMKVTVPRKFNRREDEVTYPSLSVHGNPTVVLNGSYLIDDELYLFMVKFSYNEYYAVFPVAVIASIVEIIFVMYLLWAKSS